MHRSNTLAAVAAIASAAVLTAGITWAAMVGVVTAVTKRDITVGDAVYALHEDTSFRDMTEHPIAFSEIRPGVTVELELDEEGRLTVVRANVVR
jgi:hypothetical protein